MIFDASFETEKEINMDFDESDQELDMDPLDERTDLFPVRSVDGVLAGPDGNVDRSEMWNKVIAAQLEALMASGAFDGEDGFSPIVSAVPISGGVRIMITDADGTDSIDLMHGKDGYTPQKGKDYSDGADGFSPVVGIEEIENGYRVTFTDAKGSRFINIMNGEDGDPGYTPQKGIDYKDGEDGFSPTVTINAIAGGTRVTITDKNGSKTFDVMNGTGSGNVTSAMLNAAIGEHDTNTDAHNDIRLLLKEYSEKLNAFLDVDDDTKDQLSEVLQLIESNEGLIESLTTGKVNVADIVNNLTTNVANKPLSAAQGVALKALIDAIVVPTKPSDIGAQPAGNYLTSFTETDPTVPSWAKAANKPSYTAGEVGALPVQPAVIATSSDGVSYTATVDYIKANSLNDLKGVCIVVIPDKTSTSASNVTLNVNGLGAKAIKRWDNLFTHEYWSFTTAGWFASGYPVRVIYNGTYWMIDGMNKPYANDLYGTVPLDKGGTGATTPENARTNLGAAPAYTYGTDDLVAGSSPLPTGKIHIVYE